MPRKQIPMKDDSVRAVAYVEKKSVQTIQVWAKKEGRSVQAHNGVLLDRLAFLYREQPDKLIEIGLCSPLAVVTAA